jgi:hypothetical protein
VVYGLSIQISQWSLVNSCHYAEFIPRLAGLSLGLSSNVRLFKCSIVFLIGTLMTLKKLIYTDYRLLITDHRSPHTSTNSCLLLLPTFLLPYQHCLHFAPVAGKQFCIFCAMQRGVRSKIFCSSFDNSTKN